jgi:Ni2+-binding GTPase involved in maturation of urease and hydrogenase
VRLRPRHRADIMDVALAGKTATIEAIERDLENRVHLAVVIDDDPGRDLGMLRQVGHRFFFAPMEVEPLVDSDARHE